MSSPRPPRSPVIRILDIVIGIALAFIGAGLGLALGVYLSALGTQVSTACVGTTPSGLRCSDVFLAGVSVAGWGAIVFAWFIGAGTFILRVLRGRIAFWTPLVGLAVAILVLWVEIGVIGTVYAPTV